MTEQQQRPNFLVIGAYRSGTTALRHLLGAHPDVFLPKLAEPSFFAFGPNGEWPELMLHPGNDPFSRNRTVTESEYLSLFCEAGQAAAIGEVSPEYLREVSSIGRIFEFDPAMKLVVSLRNPVDRVISDYSMHRRDGTELLSLSDALAAEASRRAAGSFGGHYLQTSCYGTQLESILQVLPRQQLHVMISERWQPDLQANLSELARFLELDPAFVWPSLNRRNQSGEPTNSLVASFFRLRRRLQPVLGDRVPTPVKERIDSFASRGLRQVKVNQELRDQITESLAPDTALLRSLLGPIPEWT